MSVWGVNEEAPLANWKILTWPVAYTPELSFYSNGKMLPW